MRLLFTTTGGIGHLHPLIPLARAGLQAGHEVQIAAPAAAGPTLAARGLPHLPTPDCGPRHLARIEDAMRRIGPPGPGSEVAMLREVFGWANTDAALGTIRAAVADWRPDLVVHEAAELAGALAAEEAGIAHATVAIALRRTLTSWTPFMTEGAGDLATSLGLPADTDGRRVLDGPCLTLVPPGLEAPGSTHNAQMRPYRLTDVHRTSTSAMDLTGAGPLIWISLGTVAWGVPGVMPRLLPVLAATARARPNVRFLLTTGMTGIDVPVLPSNVQVTGYVPQEQVLDQCAAVLGHGGFNTTVAALAAGRPLVVLPLFSTDQFETGARIAEVGAGVTLPDPTADTLAAAVDRALTDPDLAATARRLADEMASLPTPGQVLADLAAPLALQH